MQQDLSDLYNSIINGQEPRLAELTVQDSDYMAWIQQQENQGAYSESHAYWQKQFAALNSGLGAPELSYLSLFSSRLQEASAV